MTDTPPKPNRRRRWPWFILFLLVATPLALTLAGVLTSPPRAARVPVGRILYMEADEPSDHTTLLRGLRITVPGAADTRELLHETEPQDADAGSRDWLTQPKASPDGRWLAYEKQVITLQEETQAVDNQLWLLELDAPHARPRMLLDLTAAHLKQFVGLAWTPDSKNVVFLNDHFQYAVPVQGTPIITKTNLPKWPAFRVVMNDISTSRYPAFARKGHTAFSIFTKNQGDTILALSPDKGFSASTEPASPADSHDMIIEPMRLDSPSSQITARWGWSVFGGRHLTSLRFSPDGKYLGYTVSKPPFEDELFYADIATGKCYQLPIRTGPAAWDWTK